jgi:uncharacterized SAM-binding protein YcdF (DUF218 family)
MFKLFKKIGAPVSSLIATLAASALAVMTWTAFILAWVLFLLGSLLLSFVNWLDAFTETRARHSRITKSSSPPEQSK